MKTISKRLRSNIGVEQELENQKNTSDKAELSMEKVFKPRPISEDFTAHLTKNATHRVTALFPTLGVLNRSVRVHEACHAHENIFNRNAPVEGQVCCKSKKLCFSLLSSFPSNLGRTRIGAWGLGGLMRAGELKLGEVELANQDQTIRSVTPAF